MGTIIDKTAQQEPEHIDLKNYILTPCDPDRYTFIDLFAGIGGMHIAFSNAGGFCRMASEIDETCQKTYYTNFGMKPFGDIRQIQADQVPDHDILVGGFPCQPFSLAGVSKKNSMGRATGFEDKTSGTLFFEICRILKEKRPKAFVLENVKNLKSHDKGKTFRVILESLEELDYSVFWFVADGQKFVPQHRERMVIVGFDRKRYGYEPNFNLYFRSVTPKPRLSDILEADVDPKYTLTDKMWQYLQDYKEKHAKAGHGFGYSIADPNGVSRTLSARYYKDGSEILIAQESRNPRRLTPRECARLQGFPENFIISSSETQAYKQFGNSVVVPMFETIAREVMLELDRLEELNQLHNFQSDQSFADTLTDNAPILPNLEPAGNSIHPSL